MQRFVQHPLIKENKVESRLYQEVLAARILEKGNSLVIAPTALGKTIVALLVAGEILNKNPEKKIILLSPTKPLAQQHENSFKEFLKLEEENFTLLTGTTAKPERKKLYENATVISATPQTIQNDLISGNISLKDAGLVIFDESHRAVGDYAYVFIAQKLMNQNPNALILGLTASPGSTEEKISDVCKNLYIQNIETKALTDRDVKPYVNETEIKWNKVELNDRFLEIKKYLELYKKEQIQILKKTGYGIGLKYFNQTELLKIQSMLRKDIPLKAKTNPSIFAAISKVAALIKITHAHVLLETQGIGALQSYFERMENEYNSGKSSKALKSLINDDLIKKAIELTAKAAKDNVIHPKTEKLGQIVLEQIAQKPESKILVFNHYRDSISNLVEYLNQFKEVTAAKFIGQATKGKDKGMSQKNQIETIQRFKDLEFNVMCCSSVAEEGLDIPSVDLVVFYEPVPSEIRMIQRIGRTGRHSKGKVIILIAKNTRDEAFYWVSIAKQRKMKQTISKLKGDAQILPTKRKVPVNQTTLTKFQDDYEKKIIIYVDHREQSSGLAKRLAQKDLMIKTMQLEIGDYVLSDDVVVERKTTEDFLNSIIDGRLFPQLLKMNENYAMPIVLVEGNIEDLFYSRNIHRNAIIGALTSIALNYRTPILFTKDAEETAQYIYVIAKREQLGSDKEIRLRVGKKGFTVPEQQRFIVESLPMVGPGLARNLLSEFGSIKKIVNADEKELMTVEKLGKKKAKKIKELMNAEFKDDSKS